jgi:hypothetical protein
LGLPALLSNHIGIVRGGQCRLSGERCRHHVDSGSTCRSQTYESCGDNPCRFSNSDTF